MLKTARHTVDNRFIGSLRTHLAALTALAALALVPSGAAAATCDKWAARDGADTNAGTETAPYKTAQKLADSLSAGKTGCLRTGTYDEVIEGENVLRVGKSGTADARVTIRSAPGERAKLNGRIYIPRGSNFVTLSDLDIDGRTPENEAKTPVSIVITAEDTVLEANNITNRKLKSCVLLGSNSGYGVALRTIIRRNRFHDCGDEAHGRLDHHIYLENTKDVEISENVFYGAPGWAIHLYPNSQATRVARNVMDVNGGSIIFAGEGTLMSNDNIVERNVMTSTVKEPHVRGYWNTSVGSGNVARDNCLYDGAVGNISNTVTGFSVSGNLVADPNFRDATTGDYRLPSDSPCLTVLGTAGAEGIAAVVAMPLPAGAAPSAPPTATPTPSATPTPAATAAATATPATQPASKPAPAPASETGPGAATASTSSGASGDESSGSSRSLSSNKPAKKLKPCPRVLRGTTARARTSRVRNRRCVARRKPGKPQSGVGSETEGEDNPELDSEQPQEPIDTPVLSSPDGSVELDLAGQDEFVVASGTIAEATSESVTLRAFRATAVGRWSPVIARSVAVRGGHFRARLAPYAGGDWKVELSARNDADGLADARVLDVPAPGPRASGDLISRSAPARAASTRALQRRLRRSGFETAVDGRFSARTERAVRDFQRAHALLVDGIVGRQTAAALARYAG